jgi:type IV pilus assembly protein PilO
MKKSKKILYLSFIPLALVMVFVLYIIIPVFNDLNLNEQNVENQKIQIENAKIKLEKAEQDQKLIDEVTEMENKLGIFDLQVPERKELEIMLVDIEKFATDSGDKILGLNASPEKIVEITDPTKDKDDTSVKSSDKKEKKTQKTKSRKKKDKKDQGPIILQEIPLEINVLGYYPQIVRFIKKLENYERKIVIESVEARDYNKDSEQASPRIEMKITAKIFILTKNDIIQEQDAKQ